MTGLREVVVVVVAELGVVGITAGALELLLLWKLRLYCMECCRWILHILRFSVSETVLNDKERRVSEDL